MTSQDIELKLALADGEILYYEKIVGRKPPSGTTRRFSWRAPFDICVESITLLDGGCGVTIDSVKVNGIDMYGSFTAFDGSLVDIIVANNEKSKIVGCGAGISIELVGNKNKIRMFALTLSGAKSYVGFWSPSLGIRPVVGHNLPEECLTRAAEECTKFWCETH